MRINIQKSIYDVMANALCVLIIIGSGIYLALTWGGRAAKVADNGWEGAAAFWGGNWGALSFIAFAMVLLAVLSIAEHFPNTWSTGVTITEKNRLRVYRAMLILFSTVKLVCTIVIAPMVVIFELMPPMISIVVICVLPIIAIIVPLMNLYRAAR